jgi:hypothetical protein
MTERNDMSTIPEEALNAAMPILAMRDYPDYDHNPGYAREVLEAAAPAIRASFMRECAEQFLVHAATAGMPENVAQGVATVFLSFATAEEDRANGGGGVIEGEVAG